MGKTRNAYRILVGKPEGKRPLVRPRPRWVDDIKMDLKIAGNFLNRCTIGSFSERAQLRT
jgi:hypothetical protein